MRRFIVEVHCGDVRQIADWRGPARDADEAARTAVSLTEAARTMRVEDDLHGRIEATVHKAPNDTTPPQLTLWHDALMEKTRLDRRPHEIAVERAGKALIRIATGRLAEDASGVLAIKTGALAAVTAPTGAGGFMKQVYLTGFLAPAPAAKPDSENLGDNVAWTTAITAVALAGEAWNKGFATIELSQSATLRAGQRRALTQSRGTDLKTVVRFLQRLGLRDVADRLASEVAPPVDDKA